MWATVVAEVAAKTAVVMAVWTRSAEAKMAVRAKVVTRVARDAVVMAAG